MNTQRSAGSGASLLLRKLSPLAVWALSFGCSVGWGSFVMPGTTFLPIAGPLGTVIGIAVGAIVMFIIGVNYAFLVNRYPDAGGTYAFTKNLFGYDHGFLSAWFLGLVYLAIIWANATAIPLIFRSVVGDVLQFGYLYEIAGYKVYLGEILVSAAAILVFGGLCLRGIRLTAIVQIALAVLLIAGIVAGFLAVFARTDPAAVPNIEPLFSGDRSGTMGILLIVFMAPWAYAGFESVSHVTEEFKFSPKKTLRILLVGLITSAVAYGLLALMAAAAQPDGFANWTEYLKNLDGQGVVKSMPTFYGIFNAIGVPGLILLGAAAAAGIITGLVGNMTAASRMVYAMSRDDFLPRRFGKLNKYGAPKYAILFLILVSLPVPFLGRAAIGWIIDVNTIGVTIAYAYTSAAALKEAWKEKKGTVRVTGILGIGVSLFFLVYFLIPGLSSISSLATESYLMLVAWAFLGFVVFFFLFRRDKGQRLGKSTAIWLVLLLLIFLTSTVWVTGTSRRIGLTASEKIETAYMEEMKAQGLVESPEVADQLAEQVEGSVNEASRTIILNTILIFILILGSVLIIFYIYSTVKKKHASAVEDKTLAEKSSRAKSNFLANMSHDIRTPMNAIVGYVSLAKREKGLTPKVNDYLKKIEDSSGHLLALINDILEMSRIESGKMELSPVPTDLRAVLGEVQDLFRTQMQEKGLTFTVDAEELPHPMILCDKNRLDRVLLNLISNAYKFTPAGGSVTVTARETGAGIDHASYVLSVKDTGIGMSPEFAAKVFEAYARERTATVDNIQGTGLGTAITKNIVELMGGTIEVRSEQGKGSEFVIRVDFPLDPKAIAKSGLSEGEKAVFSAFAGMRILLVEDDPDNAEVERTLLSDAGFIVDTAENGEEAVETIASSTPGEYSLVMMDIEMPVKNGYETTKLIRSLRNPDLASIPIVALTAKAFGEDAAASLASGMNAHIAKPIDVRTVLKTLSEVFGDRKTADKSADDKE